MLKHCLEKTIDTYVGDFYNRLADNKTTSKLLSQNKLGRRKIK